MDFTFRDATSDDIPFLAETVIQAEKAGSDILSYSTIFGLDEASAKKLIMKMMDEEMDDCCEYSVSSFIIAERDRKTIGAVCAWAETSDGMSSSMQKGNLLKFTIPRENFEKAIPLSSMLRELHIEYLQNSINIALVYVHSNARGLGLAGKLLKAALDKHRAKNAEMTQAYIQVFKNNIAAIGAYEKFGFETIEVKSSSHPDIIKYLPSDTKFLMRLTF